MATTANNIEGINNVVTNNVNENNGYNAEVTNEVVVLNGDTFYRKNMVEGQKYRYGSHYFVIDKFEQRGTHLYYIGTLDNKPFENDLHALKVACECTERRAINRSANDTENGKAVKVKRTTKESAQLIAAKYAKAIEAINNAVAKLSNSDQTADLLHSLIDSINADCAAQVEVINNAALAAHLQRVERLQAIDVELPALQSKLANAMQAQAMDFALITTLSQQAQALQAEQLLLLQQESAYNATLASATEDTDTDTDTEAEA